MQMKVVSILVFVGWIMWMLVLRAQAPEPPKFLLSEVEQLKLENIRLKRALMTCQISAEISGYVGSVIRDHGNPQGVVFDPNGLEFRVVPPPAPIKTPTTKSKTP